jgi:dTDP-4-dehydrorhamnose reductase
MKILILGKHGMLGRALLEEFGGDSEVLGVGRMETDITNETACRAAVEAFRPDVILNAAALTRVDYCETHEAEAFSINGSGPGNLAKAAESIGALLVHYSTDYIFDGCKQEPYVEDDAPNPLSVYGRSKLEGEAQVLRYSTNYLMLRISWLFGPGRDNFLTKITTDARKRKKIRVVDDQRGSPTYTVDAAAHTKHMIRAGCRSTYHLTNSGGCTWYELAVETLKCAGLVSTTVSPVSSREFQLPAPRPGNSVLANDRLERAGLPLMRPWKEAVREYVNRYLPDTGCSDNE